MTDYSNIFELLNNNDYHELGKQLLKGLSYNERVECMCQVYDKIVKGDTVISMNLEVNDFSFDLKVFKYQIKCYGLCKIIDSYDNGNIFFKLSNLWITNTLPNHDYTSCTPCIDETYLIQLYFNQMNEELINYLITFI